MPSDTEQPDVQRPEPSEPPRPYTKPAVERIPLNEARSGGIVFSQADLVQPFSS
jgi:hypothetical protein